MNSPLNENPKTNRGLCLCQETDDGLGVRWPGATALRYRPDPSSCWIWSGDARK